ncbi:hypothetical protein [Pedobacter immunditicola]|uniref:hypothetical protein n=1 Tax=Pedobacter immunditicola TaxID=3133440 RepID=UPI003094CC22
MKITPININKGQYLDKILINLPSNAIILKELPNIGATTNELKCKRNSILLQPNVPVIKGKKTKGIFGVYEGVDVSQIMDYLSNDKYEFKKILVTPESFYKVKQAAENLNINLFEDFFLLFDECDRTMKDVGYRESIILPMQDFFSFKHKAFISATAVIPSDPRFESYGFEHVVIKPTFNYKKAIDIIISNNVSMSLKSTLMNNGSECYCIFFNSIQGISRIIKELNIGDESNIYCSKKKATELNALGIKRAHENLTTEFAKFNFFTSRFNAAVDIIMDVKPSVVMVTNLNVAHHTMIDPNSDAVQIVGRFRKGVESIKFITNMDSTLNAKTPDEAVSYLEGCEESYNVIKSLRDAAEKEGSIETLNEALELVKYASFVNADGSKNHFMVDNFIYEERVKMLFQDADLLLEAYSSDHFTPTVKTETYRYSDLEEPKGTSESSIKELTTSIINALQKLELSDGMYTIDNSKEVIEQIRQIFPEIAEGYYILGAEELAKNSYSKRQINEAIKQKKNDMGKSDFGFIRSLQIAFPDGYKGTSATIKKILKRIIEKHGLNLKAEIQLLNEYFELGPRTTVDNKKGYKIISSKFKR